MGIERRRSPRVLVARPVRARALGTQLDFTVLDVSTGGLCAETRERPPLNNDFVLDIFVPTGRVARLDARALYSRRRETPAGEVFEVGFVFLNVEEPATAAAIDALLDAVTNVFEVDAGGGSSPRPLEDGENTPALGSPRPRRHLNVH